MTETSRNLEERIQVTIFHTNDMHGRLEEMSRLSAFARRLRAKASTEGRQVFFWDAGDAADRRVRIGSITKGAAFAPILNAMGYDLQVMGNAISLPYGPQALAEVAERANFPILAANCRDGDGPLPDGLHEYALIPLSDQVTMGVIGLTAPWGDLYEIYGLQLPDFVDVARELVARLQDQGVAPIVVLSHLGSEDDQRLVGAVTGINLVVGGHSHQAYPGGEVHHDVLIVQAGDYARAVGRVDLALDSDTGRVLERSAQVLEIPPDEPPDPVVVAAIEAAQQEVEELLAQPVGELARGLELDHFQECGIGNLAADALCERMGADLAMVASGQFHIGLSSGTVTLGQLDRACFSPANPCLTEVQGRQILAALERGLDPDVARLEHTGLRGTPFGIPQVSGMVVEYHPDAAVGSRIQRVIVGSKLLDPDAHYRLAHTDAETLADQSYLRLEEDQETEHEVPTILREVMADYIRRYSPVPEPQRGRWLDLSGTSPSSIQIEI